MKFDVLKPFTWAGNDLERGDTLDIHDENPKIGSLTRSKFIRLHDETNQPVIPKVEDVAGEMEQANAEEPATEPDAGDTETKDPRAIVREAKQKAKAAASK